MTNRLRYALKMADRYYAFWGWTNSQKQAMTFDSREDADKFRIEQHFSEHVTVSAVDPDKTDTVGNIDTEYNPFSTEPKMMPKKEFTK